MLLDLVKITSQKVSDPEPVALGINVEKPKFPNYALNSKRLQSYDNWLEDIPIDKNDLVEAGLVYTGVGDSVRCYFCGGGLRNWEHGDVPMEEHARWYPKCPHILLVKGQAYVDRVNRGEESEETDVANQQCSGKEDGIYSVASKSCIEMGYAQHMVANAITIFKSRHGNRDFSACQLCEILFELEELEESDICTGGADIKEESNSGSEKNQEKGSLESLLEENRRLKENQMCKICMDNQADIIFLPCGHMVSCPHCAPALSRCPLCRKPINGHIKAFQPMTCSN